MTTIDEYVLPDWVKPGVSFRYEFGPGNHNTGRKFHIRGIVDDMAVIREWWKTKQRWNYTIEGPVYFISFKENIAL